MALDREELQSMKKKPSESFSEYAQGWCYEVSQVQTSFTDKEHVTIFFINIASYLIQPIGWSC